MRPVSIVIIETGGNCVNRGCVLGQWVAAMRRYYWAVLQLMSSRTERVYCQIFNDWEWRVRHPKCCWFHLCCEYCFKEEVGKKCQWFCCYFQDHWFNENLGMNSTKIGKCSPYHLALSRMISVGDHEVVFLQGWSDWSPDLKSWKLLFCDQLKSSKNKSFEISLKSTVLYSWTKFGIVKQSNQIVKSNTRMAGNYVVYFKGFSRGSCSASEKNKIKNIWSCQVECTCPSDPSRIIAHVHHALFWTASRLFFDTIIRISLRFLKIHTLSNESCILIRIAYFPGVCWARGEGKAPRQRDHGVSFARAYQSFRLRPGWRNSRTTVSLPTSGV